jgi:hypothetical protein
VLVVRHDLETQHPLVERVLTQFLLAPLLLVVEVVALLTPMVILVVLAAVLALGIQAQELEVLHLHLVKETLAEMRHQMVPLHFFQVAAVALMQQAVQVPLLLLELAVLEPQTLLQGHR